MFVLGGVNDADPSFLADGFFKYVPSTNTWTDLSGITGQPSRLLASSVSGTGGTRKHVLVHRGSGPVDFDIPVFRFSPRENTWKDVTYTRGDGLSGLVVGPLFMGADARSDNAYFVQDSSIILVFNTSSLVWSLMSVQSAGGPRRSTQKTVLVSEQHIIVAELRSAGIQQIHLLMRNALAPYWVPLDVDGDVASTFTRPGTLLVVNSLRFLYVQVGSITEQITMQDAYSLDHHLNSSMALNASAGEPLSPSPLVRVRDQLGQLVSWEQVTISAEIQNEAGRSIGVSGSVNLQTVDGIARFDDLRPVGVADAGSILFYSQGLVPTQTSTVRIVTGPTHEMLAVQAPVGIFPGATFFVQPVVTLVDSQENIITGDSISEVVVDLREWQSGAWQLPADATLSGNRSAQARSGVVEWTDLLISGSGNVFALEFVRVGLNNLYVPVNYTTLAETELLVEAEDGIWQSGAPSSPAIRATRVVRGRAVPDNATLLFASILNGTGQSEMGAALLYGTLNATLYNGVAVFDRLGIDIAGDGYQILLSTTDDALRNTSAPFDVVPAPSQTLRLVQEPIEATGGTVFGIQPRIEVLDKCGNLATRDRTTV
eukprot:2047682-Rhodomonas_salina.1